MHLRPGRRRSPLLAFAACLLAAAACGGHIDAGGLEDGGASSGSSSGGGSGGSSGSTSSGGSGGGSSSGTGSSSSGGSGSSGGGCVQGDPSCVCPSQPPAGGERCADPGLRCIYPGCAPECTCNSYDVWSCIAPPCPPPPPDGGACAGPAPLCFGFDSTQCCGQDPAGSATCFNGEWMCGKSPAPGCNGQSCIAIDAGTCAGPAPSCFGIDPSLCCGRDPWGVASCINGEWLCGKAPAPGCDGAVCGADAGTCPSIPPQGSCQDPGLSCSYQFGSKCEVCDCASWGSWSCAGGPCPVDGGAGGG